MSEPRPSSLPQAIEDEVLTILDGDDRRREDALRELLQRHPQHAQSIRHWLVAAGVAVPMTVVSDGDGVLRAGSGGGEFDSDTPLPQILGPYVLIERIGRGGFGTVFRGEQQEPIRRAVAVKIMNPGMDSRDLLARFTAEREALNRMDHPGIARLLDAGQTPKGRPYFVMELVAGPTLLAHCRKKHLPLRARIQLFLLVLDAMQHAHQKAMLHRDLSSNNVLVADPDGTPQPKIIDFGIAKSLADPLLHGGALTMRGTLMGTPEFMSPEQAAGRIDDLDTRADVYALGVQLYELLTDQLPIPTVALRAQGVAGVAEIVRSYEPPRPSEAAPRERRTELRGDLDGIVLRAIAKAREERYGSVGEFAADLRAFLADRPVAVAAPSTWTRLRKFVRRNRAPSLAIAVAALGLVVAFVALWSALAIARDAAEQAEQRKRLSDAKADAGFKLLANEERLVAAIEAEQALPPPWPEHAEAYARWLREHGRPLANARPKLRQELLDLEQKLKALGDHGDDADMERRHLRNALSRLDAACARFEADDGPLACVQRRQRLLAEVIAPATQVHAEAWQRVCEQIESSDGKTACRQYRGLRLGRQPGLVPLGMNPRTLLHEFLDLATHEPGYRLPDRDESTGELRTDAGSGVVFVLLPAGRLDQGALQNRPGVDRNDDAAADDELRGTPVVIDAFLISRTELTQAQWNRLVGRASLTDDPRLPVANLDWLTARETLREYGMALPTEAQWEYACRAGSSWPWSSGPDPAAVAGVGWFRRQKGDAEFVDGVHATGLLAPNAFGLFDMHGNVAEWCEDQKLPYDEGPPPQRGTGLRQREGPQRGEDLRVVRGGAWPQDANAGRATARDQRASRSREATVGVRPVRPLDPTR